MVSTRKDLTTPMVDLLRPEGVGGTSPSTACVFSALGSPTDGEQGARITDLLDSILVSRLANSNEGLVREGTDMGAWCCALLPTSVSGVIAPTDEEGAIRTDRLDVVILLSSFLSGNKGLGREVGTEMGGCCCALPTSAVSGVISPTEAGARRTDRLDAILVSSLSSNEGLGREGADMGASCPRSDRRETCGLLFGEPIILVTVVLLLFRLSILSGDGSGLSNPGASGIDSMSLFRRSDSSFPNSFLFCSSRIVGPVSLCWLCTKSVELVAVSSS